jgi:signal transduction histidine kinase
VSPSHAQRVGQQMLNRAFSRFSHVVGYCCIVGAGLDVLAYQGEVPEALIWPMVFPLLLTFAVLAMLDRWRTTAWSIAYLAVGGISVYLLGVTLLTQVPGLQSNALPISLLKVALIFVSGSGFLPRSNMLWSILGFAVAQLACFLATLQAHDPMVIDEVAFEVEIGLLLVLITIAMTRVARSKVRPELDRAAIDEELSALRFRIEVRAAALMHDTVLGHLDAVAAVAPGRLPPDLRSQIEKDLDVLIGEEWLGDVSPEVDSQVRSDWRRSALLAAVQEARELSLRVEVSGDLAAVSRLSPEQDVALGLAVKQCLVNVLRHAQIEHAELMIIGSRDAVSVMVIDSGRGFSQEMVGADRLGIRQSVRSRIEAVGGGVQLWSTPGRGTSVMLRVPASELPDDVRAVTHD